MKTEQELNEMNAADYEKTSPQGEVELPAGFKLNVNEYFNGLRAAFTESQKQKKVEFDQNLKLLKKNFEAQSTSERKAFEENLKNISSSFI